ncbi:DUF4412 domain-containing protein [Belnapia sp. F-4-1]|uniref:DUF4412 domain-containing protein n=1 Tax=Belnapia sp. F-4-1 TaxID=1545443 RepID=UPI0005BE6111|nr:DUF4412 domain-containing protein [Belnapia sp. F-4-1]
MRSFPIAAVVATLAVAPAMAQERPPLMPTRDVSVTYRVAGGQAGQEMRMAWRVADQKLRVDMPGGMGWSVMDQRAKTMFVVMEQQRMIMQMPLNNGPGGVSIPTQPPETAKFTRGGTATVAGQSCTLWRYENQGATGESCMTTDGVMLRSTGTVNGQTASMEATEVNYGPQDAARFTAPSGYQQMQMPTGAPGGQPTR